MTKVFENGPFLSAAMFCEKVLQEVDGVKSAIRIVDRITFQAQGTQPPDEMPPFNFQTNLLLQFKSGAARGASQLEIRMVKPSLDSNSILAQTIMFEGEDDRGVGVICNMNLKIDEPGVYWFYITLDGTTVTRLPLRVIYIKQIRQIQSGNTDNL